MEFIYDAFQFIANVFGSISRLLHVNSNASFWKSSLILGTG